MLFRSKHFSTLTTHKKHMKITKSSNPEFGEYDINYQYKKPRAALISNEIPNGHCLKFGLSNRIVNKSVCGRCDKNVRRVIFQKDNKKYISLSNFEKEVGRLPRKHNKTIDNLEYELEEEVVKVQSELGHHNRNLKLENELYDRQIERIFELKDTVDVSMQKVINCINESEARGKNK